VQLERGGHRGWRRRAGSSMELLLGPGQLRIMVARLRVDDPAPRFGVDRL